MEIFIKYFPYRFALPAGRPLHVAQLGCLFLGVFLFSPPSGGVLWTGFLFEVEFQNSPILPVTLTLSCQLQGENKSTVSPVGDRGICELRDGDRGSVPGCLLGMGGRKKRRRRFIPVFAVDATEKQRTRSFVVLLAQRRVKSFI